MRVNIDLDEVVLEKLALAAKEVKRSRKNYMELLLIEAANTPLTQKKPNAVAKEEAKANVPSLGEVADLELKISEVRAEIAGLGTGSLAKRRQTFLEGQIDRWNQQIYTLKNQ